MVQVEREAEAWIKLKMEMRWDEKEDLSRTTELGWVPKIKIRQVEI